MISFLKNVWVRSANKREDIADSSWFSVISRRTFTRAMSLVIFGGTAIPAVPRVWGSTSFCQCTATGECAGPKCCAHNGPCPQFPPDDLANCWCEGPIDSLTLACDCKCKDEDEEDEEDKWRYCVCRAANSSKCELQVYGPDPGDDI